MESILFTLFIDFLASRDRQVNNLWSKVWQGNALMKVEVFSWRILKGRVTVKAELIKRCLLQVDSAICVLCRVKEETVDHLFFEYAESLKIWSSWVDQWGLQWVAQAKAKPFFFIGMNL